MRAKYVVGCRRRAQRRARGDRRAAHRRRGVPRLGRDGRAREHRLPRHPHQVLDPTPRRATSSSSRARAASSFRMYVDLGEVAAGRQRRGAQDHARPDHREGERDPAPVPPRREGRRRGTASTRSATASPTGSTTCRRRGRHPDAARLHRRRRLPHAQRQGRPGHERLDAGRLEPRLEARPGAVGPEPRVAARDLLGRASGRSRRTSSTSTGSGRRSWPRSPRSSTDPSALEDFYVSTAEFPAGFMTQYQPVDDRRRTPSISRSRRASRRQAIQVRPRRACRRRERRPPRAPSPGRRALARLRVRGRRRSRGSRRRSRTGRTGWRLARVARSRGYTPAGADVDGVLDVKVVYQQRHGDDRHLGACRRLFLPRTGPLGLIDYEKVYAVGLGGRATSSTCAASSRDGVRRRGASRPVRRDVLPLTATRRARRFFAQFLLPATFPPSRGDEPPADASIDATDRRGACCTPRTSPGGPRAGAEWAPNHR